MEETKNCSLNTIRPTNQVQRQNVTEETPMLDLESVLNLDTENHSQQSTTSKKLNEHQQRKMKWLMRKAKERIENDNRRMIVYPKNMSTTTATVNTEKCPICLENPAVGTRMANLHQTHLICLNCAEELLKGGNLVCPLCRHRIL